MTSIYEYFSGIHPSAGNEFKLLYGNRDKMDSASGLAVWLFDSVSVKPENIQFTETIPNKTNLYIQLQSPHAGNEFKLLYGNKDKMDLSSDRAHFIFGDPDSRPVIDDVVIVCDQDPVSCKYIGIGICDAVGTYRIQTNNDTEKYTYFWEITSDNAEIITDNTTGSVEVKTTSNQNVSFTLKCSIIDNVESSVVLEQSFTQYHISS